MNSFFLKMPLSQCFITVTEFAFPARISTIAPIGAMIWKNLRWKLWKKLISHSEYEETILLLFLECK